MDAVSAVDAAPVTPTEAPSRCRDQKIDVTIGPVLEAGRLIAIEGGWFLPILRTENSGEILRLSAESFAVEKTEWKGLTADVPEITRSGDRTFVALTNGARGSLAGAAHATDVQLLRDGKLVSPSDVAANARAAFLREGVRTASFGDQLVQFAPSKERDAGVDSAHAVERAAEVPLEAIDVRWFTASADAGIAKETYALGRAGAVDIVPTGPGRVAILFADARSRRAHGGSLRFIAPGEKTARLLVSAQVLPEFAALFLSNGDTWAFYSRGTGTLGVVPIGQSGEIGLPSRESLLSRVLLLGALPAKTGLRLLALELESGHLHLVQCER